MPPVLGGGCPAPEVGIIPAAIDIAQLEVRLVDSRAEAPRVPIDHWNRAVVADIGEVGRLELAPAPIAHHPWLAPVNDRHLFLRARLEGREHTLQICTRWHLRIHQCSPVNRRTGCRGWRRLYMDCVPQDHD